MDRPLPSSPFLSLSSPFFDEGINKFDLLRLFREVVGVDVGVGNSFPVPDPPPILFDDSFISLLLFAGGTRVNGARFSTFGC